MLKFEGFSIREGVREILRLRRGEGPIEQPLGGQSGERAPGGSVGNNEQQTLIGFTIGWRSDQPCAETLSGFGQDSARDGGDPARSLFQPFLGALRFDGAFLVEQFPAKPAQRRNRDESYQEEQRDQASRRFEPLSRWRHIPPIVHAFVPVTILVLSGFGHETGDLLMLNFRARRRKIPVNVVQHQNPVVSRTA